MQSGPYWGGSLITRRGPIASLPIHPWGEGMAFREMKAVSLLPLLLLMGEFMAFGAEYDKMFGIITVK